MMIRGLTLETTHNIYKMTLLAGLVAVLSACSSSPSPWAKESSSPWAGRAQDEQSEPSPFVADSNANQQDQSADSQADTGSMAGVDDQNATHSEAMVMNEPEPMAEPEGSPEPMAQPDSMEPPADEVPAAAEPAPMASGGSLAEQPENYYAVQVVASSSMKNLQSFAQAHGISDQWVTETTVDGKNWYILLSGIYPDKQQAQAALDEMRTKLDTNPWIRTVGSVKAVMTP